MLLRKRVWILFLLALAVLSACNSDNEEFETFLSEVEKDVTGENVDLDKYIIEYIKQLENGEPEKVLDTLNEKVIPKNEELIEKYQDMDFENEDLTALKEAYTKTMQVDLNKQETIRDVFEKVMDHREAESVGEFEIEQELNDLFDIHKESVAVVEDVIELMEKVAEEYDQFKLDEEAVDSRDDLDPYERNEDTNLLIMAFIEIATDVDAEAINEGTTNAENQDNEVEEKEADSQGNERMEEMLTEKGSTEVVFDAEAEIKDNYFLLNGKSNLLEGSTVSMRTFHYGAENPYLTGEVEVDENGDFDIKEEFQDEALNGEPLVIRLTFQPDGEDPELQEIYGEEGEKLEGPFAHKYTNIKRTRFGAFTYADLELEEGAKAKFGIDDFEAPDDYGDMNIWMENESIETKDDYYIITMHSNLSELTNVRAEATVPGYETAGYTGTAKVRPDGSVRIHVPRPEVEDENVVVEFEARPDGALETEELYGVHGENFEGDLTNKRERGTIIEYEVDLGKDS